MTVLEHLKNALSQTRLLNDQCPGSAGALKRIKADLGTAELAFPNPDISAIAAGTPDIPGFEDSASFTLRDHLALFPYSKTETANFTVKITFLASGDQIEMILLLTPLKADWQLSQSFPSLAYSYFNRLKFADVPRMSLSTVAFVSPSGESIEPGLNFGATLALEGVLAVALTFIKGQQDGIKINGSIQQENSAATLSLQGDLSGVVPQIPGLDQIAQFEKPAFYLIATPAGKNQSICTVEIRGNVHLGKLILPVAIGVPTGIFGWSLRLMHVPDQPDLTLADLVGLFITDPGAVNLPEAFNKLGKTSLSKLYVGFDPVGNGPTILDVAILVPGPWEAVEGYIGIKNMLFALHIEHNKTGTSWYGGIKGIVELGIEVPLSLQVVPGGIWSFAIAPEEGDTKPSLSDLAKVMGGNDLINHLPPGISGSKILELQHASIRFKPSDPVNKVKQIDLMVDIVKDMDILPGFLKIKDVRADLSISNPLDAAQREVSGEISGDFLIGDAELILEAILPDKIIRARMPDLKLTELIEKFLPESAVVLDQIPSLHFKDILVELNAQDRSYAISGSTADAWPVVEGHLELNNISLDLNHSGGEDPDTSLELTGDVIIEGIPFFISATHQGKDAGWQFMGMLDGEPIPLTELLEKMMKIDKADVPALVPAVNIEVLSVSYDTATKAFSFEEETTIKWDKQVAGIPIRELDLSLKIDSEIENPDANDKAPVRGPNAGATPSGKRIYSGYLEGDLVFDNDLALILRYDFAPKNKSLQLSYDGYSCTISKVDNKTIFKLQLGYLKLGDLLVYAVNKVAPELHFKLEAPWNILNDIDLHNLTLELEVAGNQKTARVAYQVNKKFAFVEIGAIGLSFPIGGTGPKKGVDFLVSGSFAGVTYPPAKPLKWDLLNEKPPVPGKGASKFDLRYLALGQHIALKNAAQYPSIEKILAALEKSAKPVKPEDGKILSQLTALEYRADSNWFIGADLTVLDAVSFSMIFNDPELYGMVVSLKGPKVKIFDGLKFEILYKKINDEIGEYYAELQLPDAMRHLEFGAVSITLPVVAVAIYTNGNFQIDFGFPWNNNFDRSMSIQLLPFVGAGGFYFGVLNGATSKQVPKIVNGAWEPVIVFGLGLKVGVGKEINEGVFRASLLLVVQGVVEGALAVFNPANPSLAHEHYFRMQGTIGIVGQLEGAINFAIIKAQVSLKVYADARIVIESHQPIHFGLDAGIEVELLVEVLFINIHLSFKAHISQNFTIGEASPAPWQLAPPDEQPKPEESHNNAARRRAPMPAPAGNVRMRNSLEAHESVSADFGAAKAGFTSFTPNPIAVAEVPAFNWSEGASTPYPTRKDDLNLLFVPAYTVLDPGMPASKVAFVAKLFIENSIDAQVEKPFDQLVKTLFAWTLKSFSPAALGDLNESNSAGKKIGFDTLDKIYNALCTKPLPGHDDLVRFLNANFKTIKVSSGDSLQEKTNATVFPMPPELMLTAGPLQRNFDAYLKECDNDYIRLISLYLKQLQIGDDDALNEPAIDGKESFATLLFNDYFGLLIKATVQSARKFLQNFTCTVQTGPVRDQFIQYGVSFDQVEGHNHSPDFQQLVYANKDLAFTGDTLLTMKGIHFPIKTNAGNLQAIAACCTDASGQGAFVRQIVEKNLFESSFIQPAALITLTELTFVLPDNSHASIQKRFGVQGNDVRLSNAMTDDAHPYTPDPEEVYSSGAQLEISRASCQVAAHLNTLNKIAYAYGVRPGDIALANQDTYPTLVDQEHDTVLPEGQMLKLPDIHFRVPPYEKEMIAGHFGVGLDQLNLPADPDYKPGGLVRITQVVYKIQPGDSFASIGRRLGIGPDKLPDLLKDQPVLAAGKGIALPDFNYTARAKETPATVGARFGMDIENLVWLNLTAVFPAGTSVRIPNATVPVADLIRQIIHDEQDGAKNLAGMCSRFLLHGLRLPTPGQDLIQDGKVVKVAETKGLYELTGQQFDYEEALAKISLKKTGSTLKLALGAGGDELDFSLARFNANEWPALKTAPGNLPRQVAPYDAYEEVVHKFTLQQSIPWQCPLEPDYAGKTTGVADSRNPVIWLFPDNLRNALKTKQNLNLSLYAGSRDQGGQQSITSRPIQQFRWASIVSLKLKKASGNTASNAVTHPYELAGTEHESDRHLLTDILNAYGQDEQDLEMYLLYTPNPTNDLAGGLRSDMLHAGNDPDGFGKVKIIKTNLATLTPPKSGIQTRETPLFNIENQNFAPAAVGNVQEPDGPDEENGKKAWTVQVSGPNKGADWKNGNSLSGLWNNTTKNNLILRFNACCEDDNRTMTVGLGDKAAYRFPPVKIGKAWQTISLKLGDLDNLPDHFYESLAIPFCLRGVDGDADLTIYIESKSIEFIAVTKTEAISLYGQASVYEPRKFLQLAWEASIVNTEGYYLQYQNAHNEGLPTNLFSREPEAMLQLLVLEPLATGAETAVRDFHNCVVIKDSINPATQVLYVQDPTVKDWVQALKPGFVGFNLDRPKPDTSQGISSFIPVQYNLLTYQVLGNTGDPFKQSIEALPLGPRKSEAAGANADDWHYSHVIPVSRMASKTALASLDKPGLPAAGDNPYAGLGETLRVKFTWQDIFGNQAQSQSFEAQPTVLYRDPLLPVTQWPGTVSDYNVTGTPGKVRLNFYVHFDVGKYLPDLNKSRYSCQKRAENDLLQYRNIYFQMHQEDVRFGMYTSLDGGQAHEIPKDALTSYVDSVYAFTALLTKNLAGIQNGILPCTCKVTPATGHIKSIGATYHLPPGVLADANKKKDAIFPPGASINKPEYYTALFNDTLAMIDSGNEAALALRNADREKVLMDGAELKMLINGQQEMYTVKAGDTLTTIAGTNGIRVEDLAGWNKDLANLFRPGVRLLKNTALEPIPTFPVNTASSLENIAQAWSVSVEELAFANLQTNLNQTELAIPGVFTFTPDDADKSHPFLFQVDANGSLSKIAAQKQCTESDLFYANLDFRGVLKIANPIVLQEFRYVPDENDTLRSVYHYFEQQVENLTKEAFVRALTDSKTVVFREGAWILLPPVSLTLQTAVEPAFKPEVFPVTARFEIKRTAHVDPDWVSKVPGIGTVVTPLTARMEADASGSMSLVQFARQLETALGNALKVATRNNWSNAGANDVQNLWAVPIAEKTGDGAANPNTISYQINRNRTRFYAPAPLANKLVSRKKMAVQSYASGMGLSAEAQIRNFSGVDLDQWGRQFLAAVDHYLSGPYAIPAADLDENAYNQLIIAKRTLADAISASISPVLIDDDLSSGPAQLTAAREAMEERLLENLSSAYAADAVVLMDTTVNNAGQQEKNGLPRLFGKPMLTKDAPGAKDAVTLSTASIPLSNEDAFLTFLVEKTQKAENQAGQANPENISLQFQYVVNGLEIGRGKADEEGYQDYDWFSFVLPFSDDSPVVDMEVPVPLRHYPVAPALIGQQGSSAVPSADAAISIEAATKWTYGITYEQYEDSQDETELRFSFNVSDDMVMQQTHAPEGEENVDADLPPDDLFASLARFINIWPQLEEDLELLPILDRTAAGEPQLEQIAAMATKTFAELVSGVASNWLQWNEVLDKTPQTDETDYRCVVKEYAADGGNLQISVRSLNNHVPLNTIPEVQIPDRDGGYYVPTSTPELHLLNWKTGAIENAIPPSDDFQFVSAVYAGFRKDNNTLTLTQAGTIHQRQVLFGDLSLLKIQNAWAGVAISRNRDLLAGKTTNPAFVYQTPWARFPNYLTPSIRIDNNLYVSQIDSPGHPVVRSLEQHLSLLFSRLLDLHPEPSAAQEPHQIKLACKYGFSLVRNPENGQDVTTSIPVLLQPEFTFEVNDWMITGETATRETFVTRLAKAIREWQQANSPNTEGGAYLFEITLLTGSEEAERLLNFLVTNHTSNLPDGMSRTRMPLSYYVEKDYWKTAPNNQDNSELPGNVKDLYSYPAYVERMLATYGADIYDVATMQIALSLYPDFQVGTQLAREWTQRLLSSRSGILDNIRGFNYRDGHFAYGDQSALFAPGSDGDFQVEGPYFFRMIADQWAFIDPLTGESTIEIPGDDKDDPPHEGPLSWTDWKPITGENAWAAMIGPLQFEFSRSKGNMQYDSEGVRLARYILPALESMQARNGGIYYAPQNTAGNREGDVADPKSISNENNFSTYGGITMLMEALAICYTNEPDPKKRPDIQKTFDRAKAIARGMLRYFQGKTDSGNKFNLLNSETPGEKSIYTGGTYKNGPFDAGIDGFKDFAVDVHTWGCSVLGIQNIEKWFGAGTAYDLWQSVKRKSGYFEQGNLNGNILGVGYTNVNTDPYISRLPAAQRNQFILSAEWSFGAVTMCRVIGRQYLQQARTAATAADRQKYYAYAAEMLKDAATMTSGVRSLLLDTSRNDQDVYAYYYANRRYFIPFGWFANRVDSLCSTSWALMVMNDFNPFVLGGSYDKKVIDPNTFEIDASLDVNGSGAGADYFEEFFLAGIPAGQHKLINFLITNNTKNLRNPDAQFQTGMPLSFFVNTEDDQKNFWLGLYNAPDGDYKKYCNHPKTAVDAATERVLVHYGVNIYDASTMQIALAIFPAFRPGMLAAKDQTLRLLHGLSIPSAKMPESRPTLGAPSSIRGWTLTERAEPNANVPVPEAERFYYGKDKTSIFPDGDNRKPGAFYFRSISEQFYLQDPLKINNRFSHNWPSGLKVGGSEKISWLDWKPITGENAWACLIGPLQYAFSEHAGIPPLESDEVQLALKVLPAYLAMQAENGGIFYAPWNTAGNIANTMADPFSISNENNFSSFAGLTMLRQILEARGDTGHLPDVDRLLAGLESYFEKELYDAAENILFTGGTYNKGNDPKTPVYSKIFTKGGSNYPFAVDVHTWGCTVLGVDRVDKWFGEGTAFGLWQTVKRKAGYYVDNQIRGVGYTDVETDQNIPADAKNAYIISAEWSFGAVTMCLVLAEQYDRTDSPFYNPTYAGSLRADAQSMSDGIRTLLLDQVSRDRDTEAYRYANRRYFIPFGWFGNPIDSLCSTAWAIMCANRFNPFQLGGDYSGRIVTRNHGASVKQKEHKPVLRLGRVVLGLEDVKEPE
jgi:hypothetical protein